MKQLWHLAIIDADVFMSFGSNIKVTTCESCTCSSTMEAHQLNMVKHDNIQHKATQVKTISFTYNMLIFYRTIT